MQPAAAGAGHVVDIEQNILARQMVGQRFAMEKPFGVLLLDLRTLLVFAGEIAAAWPGFNDAGDFHVL